MKNTKNKKFLNLKIICVVLMALSIGQGAWVSAHAKSKLIQVITPTEPSYERDIITIQRQNGTEITFDVELAITEQQHQYGLMNREELPEDEGMIFIFEKEAMRSFWMRNTLVPLDIAFISKDGTIHHIHHSANPLDETRITSAAPSLAVLEILGGTSEKVNLKIGDRVIYKTFRNTNLAD